VHIPTADQPDASPPTVRRRRALRLARRLIGGAAAAWVPLAPDAEPVIEGPLKASMARELARTVGDVGSGMAVSDLGKVPALAPVATWFHFLIAVPVAGERGPEAVLLVLGHGERYLTPDDFAALADAAALTVELDRLGPEADRQPGPAGDEAPEPSVLAHLVRNAPVGVFALDASGVFTISEGLGVAALGLAPRDAIGRSVFEMCASDERLCEAVRLAIDGAEGAYERPIDNRILETTLAPVRNPAGGVSAVIGMSVDATLRAQARQTVLAARIKAEEARAEAEAARLEAERSRVRAEEARSQAEAAARAQSSFLASMSHEIRTPLTSIIGFADVLAEDVEGEPRSYALLIRRSGRRLLETLNSVLNYARLEAADVEARHAPIDISAPLADVVAMLRPAAREKGLDLAFRRQPAIAETDPALVHRIATNLLSNAIKFTDVGAVTVSTAAVGDRAVIRVSDTGRGMQPGFVDVLFDPFTREHDEQEAPAGTGLGLSITWRLVEMLGGTIEAESEPGVGSTFVVSLPRAPGDPMAAAVSAGMEGDGQATPEPQVG
jgi:signal transduction histidine kinase